MDVLNVLVGVVHHGVEAAGDVHQDIPDPLRHPAEAAPQLGEGVLRGGGALGVDEVHDGLCLGEVQLPVQEGLAGELPRPRLPRPLGEEGLEPQPQHDGGAVAVELRAVLPGVAVGGGEEDRQAVVHGLPVRPQEVAPDQGPGGVGGEGTAVPGAEHRLRRGDGGGTGDAQHPDGGDPRPGGDGGNGIHRQLLSCKGKPPQGGFPAIYESSSSFRTARKASVGTWTVPRERIFFLPSFCFSSSFFFRVTSPP